MGPPSSKQLRCWEGALAWCLLQPLQTMGHRAGGQRWEDQEHFVKCPPSFRNFQKDI